MSKTNEFGALGSIGGYIYQVYYFLYRLLTIRDGETVSLEKIDDVGVEDGESRIYYQLKHSKNSKLTGVMRMADRDTNLWKTLNMWVSIVKKQGDEDAQREWMSNSEFVLISNRTMETNKLIDLVKAYKADPNNKWEELEKYLSEQASKDPKEKMEGERKKNIYVYTKNVNEYRLKAELFKQVTITCESDDELLKKIDKELQSGKFVPEERVQDARYMVMGKLIDSVIRGKAEYTMDSFAEAYGRLFRNLRERKYITVNRKVKVPVNLMEQTFVKQLLDVDVLRINDANRVIDMTTKKLEFENNYRASNNSAGIYVQRQFEKDMHTEWRNIFDDHNYNLDFMSAEKDKQAAGKEVWKEVKSIHLKYDQEDIGPSDSNGCFYHFSDGESPQIGWRCDWESLYNGREWTTD